jgi:DNA-binding NtrC family response regulator
MTIVHGAKGSAQILVVEDDPIQRRLLKNAIERYGHLPHMAENGRIGLDMLKRNSGQINVIVLDLMMPEMNGIEFLGAMHELGLDIPVIVQTGQGGIETVVQAMRAGAFDFVVKPVSPERIAQSIANALRVDRGEAKARAGRRSRSGAVGFEDIVSASPAMMRVIDLAQRAAQSNIPVVLEGESGVGKELVARAIQAGSDRSGKPFVTVNCGAIPQNLVESILFGHEKGAFTGAAERHLGKFMEADGGTLFLDEIGDLPLDVQVKLLRAVQQGEIETIGARVAQKVNVRLISATNKDLIEEVKAGRFREDLYYRLNVFPIIMPALRKRKEDIPYLARAFVTRIAHEQAIGRSLSITPAAMALLTAYDWPGNIRQLENAIFRAVILSQASELDEEDFPQIAAQLPGYFTGDQPTLVIDNSRSAGGAQETEAVFSVDRTSRMAIENMVLPLLPEDGSNSGAENMIVSIDPSGDVRKLADVEEELIRFALKFYRGQMSQVARKLGIGRSTLYRKLKDYGIDPDDPQKHAA